MSDHQIDCEFYNQDIIKHNCRIEGNECGKFYYNEKNQPHRLNGPAAEYKDVYKDLFI